MTVSVLPGFIPLSINLESMNPVMYRVSIKNTGSEPATCTLIVEVPLLLRIDKTFGKVYKTRIGPIDPGREATDEIKLFPRSALKEGIYEIQTKVIEHGKGYNSDHTAYSKVSHLRVE